MVGKHAIKHWSSAQSSNSLSSGEAAFAGVIRGSGQGLGYQSLLNDADIQLPLRVWTDSTASIGICSSQGLGKLRRLDAHTLWIQQAVRTGRVDVREVPGESNPADFPTKHSLSRQKLQNLLSLYSCKRIGGRAETAPHTAREPHPSQRWQAKATTSPRSPTIAIGTTQGALLSTMLPPPCRNSSGATTSSIEGTHASYPQKMLTSMT